MRRRAGRRHTWRGRGRTHHASPDGLRFINPPARAPLLLDGIAEPEGAARVLLYALEDRPVRLLPRGGRTAGRARPLCGGHSAWCLVSGGYRLS